MTTAAAATATAAATTVALNLTTATPVEIDTFLAANWKKTALSLQWLAAASVRLERFKDRAWGTLAEAKAEVEKLRGEIAVLRAEAAPYQAEYGRRPWKRYFLVTNGNGHVHRGMDCSTCYPTTSYAWIVDLADCDEGKMVVEYGEKACTVCFPDAPTNVAFRGPGRRDAAAKAERQAAKVARDAVKASKAITAPDGSPLQVGGDYIATKVAARNALSRAVQNVVSYGVAKPVDADHKIRLEQIKTKYAERVEVLTAALVAAGVDPAPIVARAPKKAKKVA